MVLARWPVEEYSYRRNNVFESSRPKSRRCTERVGVLDLTGFAKFDIRGARAPRRS